MSLIPRARLRGLHAKLARALSKDEGADAVDRARHWDLAGDHPRAIEAYDAAAQAAFAAELGVRLPRTRFGMLLQALYLRMWIALRGSSVKRREPGPREQEDIFLACVLRKFALAFSPFDPLAPLVMLMRALLVVSRVAAQERFADLQAAMDWMRTLGGAPSTILFERSRQLAARAKAHGRALLLRAPSGKAARRSGARSSIARSLLLPAIEQIAGVATADSPARKPLGGRFEVLGTLGGGGFGDVVEARDVHSGRLVALKELVNAHPRSLERFKQEFRAIRDVHHPNLVRLDSLFEHEGAWYISMEILPGQDLLSYTRPKGVPDLSRIARAYQELASGLSALHEAGFAHRDVTAGNVRVTEEGRAVLLDFGLIGRLGELRAEGPVGSAEYAAPEQLRGSPPSAAADVYGLGACLFQSITGHLPFEAEPPALLLEKRQHESPRRGAPPGSERAPPPATRES